MIDSATIIWKNKEVGKVSNITNDMWYFSADWLPYNSEHSTLFCDIAAKLTPDEVMRSPTSSVIVLMQYEGSSSEPSKMLMLSLKDSIIYMRIISDEVAAYSDISILPPWQNADKPAFYEKMLKKEVSFFHPLRWKKLQAIGFRTDQDDVLFEIANGSPKYAIVHLTYTKERSRKFPYTEFYKDWDELYKNRLVKDHKEWNSQ